MTSKKTESADKSCLIKPQKINDMEMELRNLVEPLTGKLKRS